MIRLIGDHVQRYLGPIAQVLHDSGSPGPHIDLFQINPNQQRSSHAVVTCGMSALPMSGCPDKSLRYAELMIFLPLEWKVDYGSFQEERSYWPFRLLLSLSKYVHGQKTWLGPGHTVPNGKPFDASTKMCGVLLCPTLSLPAELIPEFSRIFLDKDTCVNFYSLYPLYESEMKYALRSGPFKLMDRFLEHGVTDLLDVSRSPVI